MRRKASRLRLSPNEEAQLLREELENRRRLRLQQVREQERCISRQVRRQVEERRQQQLQILTHSLQQEWQQQHTHTLQTLSLLYQQSLRSVGHGQRSAQENEPDVAAWAQKSVERQERAEERHQEALRKLSTRRHEEQEQRCRHIEARRRALAEEKRRSERVASLPPPPPNPVESIGKTTARPLKAAATERFSATHCHMPGPAVERETHTEQQLSARQAAALEVRRLEELEQEEARERQEQRQTARARGSHALRREQHTQDRARLLCELERLQQADLLRRRQEVVSVPAHIFQPLYRQEELRDERQRDLEIAFQDVCAAERKVKGDVVLQLVPEPLPPPSAASRDEELDVTLDPEGEEPDPPVTEAPGEQPVGEQHVVCSDGRSDIPGRRALRKLLDRIRSQRERQRAAALTEPQGDSSVETGSLSSREIAEEEQTPSPTHTDHGPDASDEAVLAGALLPPEEREPAVSDSRETHEEDLLRRQQEQLAVLEELDEKRRELEQRLRASQQRSRSLRDAGSPPPPPEVCAEELQTQRLHEYQQRLLQQNRIHRKSVEEARRRLQEYQHTLRLRQAVGSAPLQPPHVSAETVSDGTPAPPALPPAPSSCGASLPPCAQQTLLSPAEPAVSSAVPEAPAPLPSPAVVLELLRSRLHQAARAAPQPADITSCGPAGAVQSEMRRQRDALQALIAADVQADHMTLSTLLNPVDETSSQSRPPAAAVQRDGAALTLSNEPAPVHGGRGKPPVSRPPARLPMAQHELSAIQEVDTPLNVSLDAELQSQSSHGRHSPDERSQVTGGVSRRSWREMLLLESTASPDSSSVQRPGNDDDDDDDEEEEERFSAGLPSSVDPEHLSSTTISTGTYCTSEPEADEPDACADRQEVRASVQQVMEKYSRELSASLTRAGPGPSWSRVLLQELRAPDLSSTLLSGQTDSFLPLQPRADVSSSSSSSRDDSSRRAQGWSETVNRLLERLSDQLSVRYRSEPSVLSSPAPASSRVSHESSLSSPGTAHVSDSSAVEPQDPSPSRERLDGSQSVVMGRASDMGSSQVFDQSTAALVSGGPVRSSQRSDEDSSAFTDAPQDDASDVFLPLPSDVTNNESVDCSTALCAPLEADPCDESDPSLQQLRADAQMDSHADLQVSVELLSLTQQSLCDTDDVPRSPLHTQDASSALSRLLERAQAAGDEKGILEESTISFISLPESTLLEPEDCGREAQEAGADLSEGPARSGSAEDSPSQEPSLPHAVMLLEFESGPARRQRREGLAQRSALRAAQVKSRAAALQPDAADGLKSVAEVRICGAAQRRVEEAEMHRRTQRLYSQLEEVKQQKQFQSRQESYAKNREKARDFHRKTLEKLRGKLKA